MSSADTKTQESVPQKEQWRATLHKHLVLRNQLVREMLAECLGTFILMTFGNGSVAQSVLSREENGQFLSINWAFGLGVTMAIFVTGRVSGAHINPAVSTALCVFRKFPLYKLPCYILAQVFGAFISAAAVFSIYLDALNAFDGGVRQVVGPNATAGIFSTYPQGYLSIGAGLWDQVFGTALLVGIIFAVTDEQNNQFVSGLQPFIIGLLVFVIGTSFGLNCGYAINPARDFGPRLFTLIAGWGTGVFTEPNGRHWWWVPIVGPIIGGLVGAAVYNLLVGIHLPAPEEFHNNKVGNEAQQKFVQEDFNNFTPASVKPNITKM